MSGYRKVPNAIREQITACNAEQFYVGRTRSFTMSEIAAGVLGELGITSVDGELRHEESILLGPENGRWSKWNLEGRRVCRKDLPKVEKSWGWDSPNFGDWNRGSHPVSFTKEVYQWQIRFGRRLALLIDSQQSDDETVVVGIRVDRVFDRSDIEEDDLLMACSLVRENFGSASILPSDVTAGDWLARQRVQWELLPIGQGTPRPFDEVAGHLNADPGTPRMRNMRQRYDTVLNMNPGAVVVGSGEFTRYFGFKFRDDLVALENLDYGNALYVMYEDWPTLSQRSRLDLLSDPDANFDRVVHQAGWAERLANLLVLHGHNPRVGPN